MVLVHNVEIMNDWIKDLNAFLTINEELPTYTTPKGTRRSIINGAVEYIPRKTKDGRPVVVRVPLLKDALEILDRYKDLPGAAILPLISQQKYNVAIKTILQPVNQRPALYMKSCPRIQQEGPFLEICIISNNLIYCRNSLGI